MSDLLYQLSGVRKSYDGKRVLDIPELRIHHGEILAIVGPSGAGKSTLLRLLNFLEPPDAGSITYRGFQFDANHEVPLPIRRQVTTVFQKPILLSRNVAYNVAFGLRLRGIKHTTQVVEQVLEQVGLGAMAHKSARKLSGGEAQRVALARALCIQPQVMLLDEPTANLDPYNVALIEKIVRETNQMHGTTIVLVTHNVFQARRLAHRVGLLLEGRLVELAPAELFFQSPQDQRTKAFIHGEMIY